MQDGRKHHDEFEHPRRQAPELGKEPEDRMLLLLGHFVVAVRLPAEVHLNPGETCVVVYPECFECVGNRRGCDIRNLHPFRLRGWCLGGRVLRSGFHRASLAVSRGEYVLVPPKRAAVPLTASLNRSRTHGPGSAYQDLYQAV